MTTTVEIFKEMSKNQFLYRILHHIYKVDKLCPNDIDNLVKSAGINYKYVQSSIDYLDKVALIDNVHTNHGSYYRVSERGKHVIKIISDIV